MIPWTMLSVAYLLVPVISY
uniref:Uncharacterized protein n=1 Tax=Arundo donax TaxID=35708 RepID=A0A0A8ZG55_ARUDO